MTTFARITWVDEVTKVGPVNMNRIEAGIEEAHARLDAAPPGWVELTAGSSGSLAAGQYASNLWTPVSYWSNSAIVAARGVYGTGGELLMVLLSGGFESVGFTPRGQTSLLFRLPSALNPGAITTTAGRMGFMDDNDAIPKGQLSVDTGGRVSAQAMRAPASGDGLVYVAIEGEIIKPPPPPHV